MLYDKQRAGISLYQMYEWLIIRCIPLSVGEVYVGESSLTQMGRTYYEPGEGQNQHFYCKTKPSPSSNSEYLPSYHHKILASGSACVTTPRSHPSSQPTRWL